MDPLVTQRTTLRRFRAKDFENMRALESDPEVMRFTPARVPLSEEQTEKRLQALIDKEKDSAPLGVWAVELKGDSDFVGWFMLAKRDEEYPELGFMIRKKYWHQGLATEVAQRLIEYGMKELGHSKIIAVTDQTNVASMRVLKKLGFELQKEISRHDKVLNQEIRLNYFTLG